MANLVATVLSFLGEKTEQRHLNKNLLYVALKHNLYISNNTIYIFLYLLQHYCITGGPYAVAIL